MEQQNLGEVSPNSGVRPNPAGAKHWQARATEAPQAAPERTPRDLANPYVLMAIAVAGGAAIGTVLGLVR